LRLSGRVSRRGRDTLDQCVSSQRPLHCISPPACEGLVKGPAVDSRYSRSSRCDGCRSLPSEAQLGSGCTKLVAAKFLRNESRGLTLAHPASATAAGGCGSGRSSADTTRLDRQNRLLHSLASYLLSHTRHTRAAPLFASFRLATLRVRSSPSSSPLAASARAVQRAPPRPSSTPWPSAGQPCAARGA